MCQVDVRVGVGCTGMLPPTTNTLRRQPWLDPNATWYEEFQFPGWGGRLRFRCSLMRLGLLDVLSLALFLRNPFLREELSSGSHYLPSGSLSGWLAGPLL